MPGRGLARLFICAVVISSMLVSCSQNGGENKASKIPAASAEPLRICTGTSYSILLIISEQKGLFAKEGLKVELKPYAIGREAIEAMLSGSCDAATSADTPIADYGLKREDLRVISGIANSDRLSCVVAAGESGIRKFSDLKGRRVGAVKGTSPHFFLDLVLNKNRMTENDVKLQFMKGDELHTALIAGKLDAIVTTDMNAYRMEEKQGDNILVITYPGIVLNHGYLTVLDVTLEKRKGDLRRMISALKAAEKIVVDKPDEAKQLFSNYLKVSQKVSDRIWEGITPKLSLDASMVLTLEDNARWLKEREGGTRLNKSFREIIKPELLRGIAPESVSF